MPINDYNPDRLHAHALINIFSTEPNPEAIYHLDEIKHVFSAEEYMVTSQFFHEYKTFKQAAKDLKLSPAKVSRLFKASLVRLYELAFNVKGLSLAERVKRNLREPFL